MPTYKILYDAIHSAMVIRIVVKRILFETLIFFSGMRVTLDFLLDRLCWCLVAQS